MTFTKPESRDEPQELTYRFKDQNWRTFTLTVRARYLEEAGESGTQRLGLPQPFGTSAGKPPSVTVSVPENEELTVADRGNAAFILGDRTPREQVWRPDPAADRADALTVAWQPYRPEVRAVSVVHVFLKPNRVEVLQELRLTMPQAAPEPVGVKLTFARPPGMSEATLRSLLEGGNLSVRRGGTLTSVEAGAVLVTPNRVNPGEDQRLVLEYSLPLPPAGPGGERAPILVPLAAPETATSTETRVRIWPEPGALPRADGDDWSELPVEEVASRVPGETATTDRDRLNRLPVLVLRSTRRTPMLSLRFGESAPPPGVTVLADRALVRVTVREDGSQQYRVGVHLLAVFGRTLDVELPGRVSFGLDLKVQLDGYDVDVEPVDEEGRHSDSGRFARLRLPAQLPEDGSILEISYQLKSSGGGRFQTGLQPPVLRGAGQVPTRWWITLPAQWVPLGPAA
jgi:hypothetical protein